MQLVNISLTPLQRRNRVAFAVTSAGAPVPCLGEHVVVRDQSGSYFGAVVVDTSYDESGRGAHRLRIGASLPESIAQRRLARNDFLAPCAETLHRQLEEYLAEAAAFGASFGGGSASVPHQA